MKNKQKQKRRYKNGATKLMTVPNQYQAGFLQKLDGRLVACRELRNAFNEIVADAGGVERLSHIEICLCEKFTFLEFVLKNLEYQIVSEPKKSARMLSRWIQGLNSLVGLAKSIGLQRRAKKIPSLAKYVEGKRK